MQTITFSAIKGGVGKSSLAILTANCLAASGAKVLAIDADPQNSLSFYYNPDSLDNEASLASVLTGDKAANHIIPTAIQNISLIPSALELIKCRDCEPMELAKALQCVSEVFDYCVIDTAPTYDNVVLNCINVADKIIIPAQFSSFDYKSAIFYRGLLTDAGAADKFQIVFNRFKRILTGTSINAQYLEAYNNAFGVHGEIVKNRIPDSAIIKQYFDTGARITRAKLKLNIFNAIVAFVEEITGSKLSVEAF